MHPVLASLHFLQFVVQISHNSIMERSVVHWEMMEFLPLMTLVVSHVILVMALGPVRVMGSGVAVMMYAEEVMYVYVKALPLVLYVK